MLSGQHKNLEIWQFNDLKSWLSWLERNHTQNYGIWAKIAKKNTGVITADYKDLREGALCYGWIDSVPNKVDETFYLLKFTPRRKKSIWSKINVALCEEYIAAGKMNPSGLKEVNEAKADGRWEKAY